MQFVEHDVAQILEQAHPFRVVRQNSGMQHVRIREDHVPAFADRLARVAGRIAVVGEHAKAVVEARRQIVQLRKLVLRERLGGKQVESARVAILEDRIQHGQVVAESFAGGGGRHHHEVFPGVSEFGRGGLVRIQLLDALRSVSGSKFEAHPLRHRPKLRRAGGNMPHGGEHFVRAIARRERAEHLLHGVERAAGARASPEGKLRLQWEYRLLL